MASVDKMLTEEERVDQNVRDITNQVDTSNIQTVPLSMFKQPPVKRKTK